MVPQTGCKASFIPEVEKPMLANSKVILHISLYQTESKHAFDALYSICVIIIEGHCLGNSRTSHRLFRTHMYKGVD